MTHPIQVATAADPDHPSTSAATPREPQRRLDLGYIGRFTLLAFGALVFLFPFYYMLVGSLQAESDTSVGGAFPIGGP